MLVVLADWYSPVFPAAVVSSLCQQVNPFVTICELLPIVIITVHEFAPSVNLPADVPPVLAETEQPEVVNLKAPV